MSDLTRMISPEVVEAACIDDYGDKWTDFHPRFTEAFKDLLRAKKRKNIAAGLAAWPGRKDEWRNNINLLTGQLSNYSVIILPHGGEENLGRQPGEWTGEGP